MHMLLSLPTDVLVHLVKGWCSQRHNGICLLQEGESFLLMICGMEDPVTRCWTEHCLKQVLRAWLGARLVSVSPQTGMHRFWLPRTLRRERMAPATVCRLFDVRARRFGMRHCNLSYNLGKRFMISFGVLQMEPALLLTCRALRGAAEEAARQVERKPPTAE